MGMETTILDRLDGHARERGDRPALSDPRNDRFDAWDTLTWRDYQRAVRDTTRAFVALGNAPGDAVCIIGPNRTAWVRAYLGAIAAGGLPAGIYPTATADQVAYILEDSGASIAVVCDRDQAEKILSRKAALPHLKAVVLFPGVEKCSGTDGLVYTWEDAHARGENVSSEAVHGRRSALRSEAPGTLIYTSGTTGPPKAVMLSHHNTLWTAHTSSGLFELHAGDRALSYLPLAHIAEQMLTIHGSISHGVHTHFVPAIDLLVTALVQVRPHYLLGVPRVWEKIQSRVEVASLEAPAVRRAIFGRAKRVGLRVNRARFEGRKAGWLDAQQYRAFERLVYGKLRERLGLDQARVLLTGAAPLSPATRDWFLAVGSPLSEVYGQSEGCGPTSFNVFGAGRLGTVGRPMPGTEVKIGSDGEILVSGPNVFVGYKNRPEETQAVLQNGWLHSGDVGELDGDGFLRLTDRKKDLIITAGGKNIAPQNIEKLLQGLDLVSQAVVIGDQRKFLSALLALDPDKLERFAQDHGFADLDGPARAAHPKVREAIQDAVDRYVNPNLARYETIKRFEILPEELSVQAGELTATLKIKRSVVNARHRARIEKIYADVP